MPKYDVLGSMLNGQPIKVAPLYNPLPGPSTQNVKNTAFELEGLFKEGTFEKVIYRNPNGTVRDTPYCCNPEDVPVYRGPSFVPTVNHSLQNETITPEGGICMPPRLLNGFEMALAGRMAEVQKAAPQIAGPTRDEVFDAISEWRDEGKKANYDKKLEHLMTQGFSKEEVDSAMAEKRKEHLMSEIAKPTPVAPVTVANALNMMTRREFNRPEENLPEAKVRFLGAGGKVLTDEERKRIVRGAQAPIGFGNIAQLVRSN
jgi:hypothetical protein